MNFFEQQDKARRQTRVLVTLFSLAVIGIVLAINALVLGAFGLSNGDPVASPGQFLKANTGLILLTTAIAGGIIGLASAFRAMQLRGGGGEVARELGGSLVEPDTTDPLRRRLRNVVEEMAIASGIPVPEIYVLEHEQGINAFAAGYSPADAAVAVTRGALENLDRDELQGVIAHEFSHIFNGDMRLNVRLIGFLFGILVISIIGRRLLMSARFARDSRNAAPAVLIGLAVVIIGYIGLFFGRWIKAAVSRQREFLADASAVQFTRDPRGIGGALKKIGALNAGSFMTADSEEVGHMLFARGMGYQIFATHPPLEKRIQSIDPSFTPDQFKDIAAELNRHTQARKAEAEQAARSEREGKADQSSERGPGGLPLNPDNLAEQIGHPGLNQVFLAAALAAAIPKPLERAAHSDQWAQEVICYLLLSADSEIREQQLLMIAKALGSDSERQVSALREAAPELAREQRLPLMEIAFPALRRRPAKELVALMRLIDELVHADGHIDVFEYAMARLTNRQIEDVLNPSRAVSSGSKTLKSRTESVKILLAVLAHHGHPDQPELAQGAYAVGLEAALDEPAGVVQVPDDWPDQLDHALAALDRLKATEKGRLVAAMARVVMYDEEVVAAEMELMRVVCGVLHVPLPLIESSE